MVETQKWTLPLYHNYKSDMNSTTQLLLEVEKKRNKDKNDVLKNSTQGIGVLWAAKNAHWIFILVGLVCREVATNVANYILAMGPEQLL